MRGHCQAPPPVLPEALQGPQGLFLLILLEQDQGPEDGDGNIPSRFIFGCERNCIQKPAQTDRSGRGSKGAAEREPQPRFQNLPVFFTERRKMLETRALDGGL